jgi:type IV secretion system protein VirB8
MKADNAVSAYLQEAASWDMDRRVQARRAVHTAWWVAGAACAATLMALAALVLMLPLKRTEPFLVRVDHSTGVVDVVPVLAGGASMDEAVTRYFLTHYVSVCERFNAASAESDYEECGAFHTAARNQAWYALWNRNNPASPLNVYKDGSSVRTQVESVSFFKRANGLSDLAQVRYLKARRQGTGAEQITHWIATVQYAYGTPSQDPKTRGWDPLGFKVMDFSTEPEVLAEDGR